MNGDTLLSVTNDIRSRVLCGENSLRIRKRTFAHGQVVQTHVWKRYFFKTFDLSFNCVLGKGIARKTGIIHVYESNITYSSNKTPVLGQFYSIKLHQTTGVFMEPE